MRGPIKVEKELVHLCDIAPKTNELLQNIAPKKYSRIQQIGTNINNAATPNSINELLIVIVQK